MTEASDKNYRKRRAQLDKLIAERVGKPRPAEKRLQYMNTVSEIVFMLLGAEMTCQELADDTGTSINTVRGIIKAFRNFEGIIFISDWKFAKGGMDHHRVPVYTMKKRKGDAPAPAAKDRKQIAADYRARKKKERAISAGALAHMSVQLTSKE